MAEQREEPRRGIERIAPVVLVLALGAIAVAEPVRRARVEPEAGWHQLGGMALRAEKDQERAAPRARGARANSMPRSASSYYLKTVRPSVLNRRGCAVGTGASKGGQPRDALVVLALGRPRKAWGRYGVSLFRDAFAPTAAVRRAGVAFASGFWRCSRGKVAPTLRIALGTSNYGRSVSWGHGRAWALMVNAANEELADRGYASRIDVVGANDIELSWNGPGVSKAWVRGYDSANRWPYYNFGDAAACPPYGDCAGAWTLADVYWVSWGAAPAIPLPQIYTGSGSSARQWYRVSLYGHQRHGEKMAIAGVMSQHEACHQSKDPCHGMNNTPSTAWKQLWRTLNSDRRTAQDLRWVTDIRWRP